jgi:hypothetical protein
MRSCQSGMRRCRAASISRSRRRISPLHLLRGRIDRDVRFVRVIQEREHPVILFLRERIVFMVVALRALNGHAENALADGVHAVEHRLHAELFGLDAAFFVDHRIAQKAGGDFLILRGIRQQIAGNLVDDELVVGQVAVEGVDHPVAIEPDEARACLFRSRRNRRSGPRRASAGPIFRRSAARRADGRPASRRRSEQCRQRSHRLRQGVGGRPVRSSTAGRAGRTGGTKAQCFVFGMLYRSRF